VRQASRRRVRAALGAATTAGVLLLAGCATSAGPGADGEDRSGPVADVDVDTPELRAAKERAGIEDCPAPGADSGSTEEPPEPLPALTLPCLGGGPDVDLSTLRGPMVVNLWAQWCGPCREELPYYQQLHEQAGDEVQVLGVDYQDTRPEWALDLLDQTGVTYPSLADPGGELRVPFRVRGLPAIVLVDEDGGVAHREFVVIESYEQLATLVEEHLGVDVGTAG
jgi:thiol-disulfide isomerase/thioredoxin